VPELAGTSTISPTPDTKPAAGRTQAVPFDGLVQITDFKDTGRMTPNEYPALESTIDAVVLGFKETGNQIWLGMKSSRRCRAEMKENG
jgi:hypothetical protein